jgi:hypothetical protein
MVDHCYWCHMVLGGGGPYLLQLLHVERLIQVQTSILILVGSRVNEPLQESLWGK